MSKKLYDLKLQIPWDTSPPGATQDEHELLDLQTTNIVNTSAYAICVSIIQSFFAYSHVYTSVIHIN